MSRKRTPRPKGERAICSSATFSAAGHRAARRPGRQDGGLVVTRPLGRRALRARVVTTGFDDSALELVRHVARGTTPRNVRARERLPTKSATDWVRVASANV